jgi:hypothetical protein
VPKEPLEKVDLEFVQGLSAKPSTTASQRRINQNAQVASRARSRLRSTTFHVETNQDQDFRAMVVTRQLDVNRERTTLPDPSKPVASNSRIEQSQRFA